MATGVVPAAHPSAAPGWYPAPDGAPYLRRWTGAAWTAEIAALPVVAAATVTYVPVKTNHILHLILTLLTGGLWLPVWILVSISHSNSQRAQITRPL